MTDTQNIIKLQRRDTGKTVAKSIRNQGLIPGVYYIKTGESIPFAVEPKNIKDVVYTSEIKILNVTFDEEQDSRECILKQVDFDPVTDEILHLDFYGIIRGQKFTAEIPFIIKGSAKGVREGGILQQSLRFATISCFPKDMPNSIEIDISDLELGQTIYLKDLDLQNVEFHRPEDTPIVSIVQPRIIKEGEESEETEAEEVEGEETAEDESNDESTQE